MKLKLKPYLQQREEWPENGHHIMGQFSDEHIIVYQSYRPEIGEFAFKNQYFGGAFSLDRMTWIKPNFLWMMYRNGWGFKEGQTTVLAISLKRSAFEFYLRGAIHSTFHPEVYSDRDSWREEVRSSDVRLQWDPDHDPFGNKVVRRAVQIGLRNEAIRTYSKADILGIEDISEFARAQYEHVKTNRLDLLETPEEKPLSINDAVLAKKLQLDGYE